MKESLKNAAKFAVKNPGKLAQGAATLYALAHAVTHDPKAAVSMVQIGLSRAIGEEPPAEAKARTQQYTSTLIRGVMPNWVIDAIKRE